MDMDAWEDRAEIARNYRDATPRKVEPPLSLPEPLAVSSQHLPEQLLTAREHDLTQNYSASDLLRMIRDKDVTVEEITRAFLRRAAVAHYATNCLTELMWDEAIARARHLDSLSRPLGPLHGLPISIKEHQGMHVYDKSANVAYVAWIGEPSPPSLMNDILFDAGCVFYARTNQPQTLQMIETNNNIYGRTVNPWNRNLSCGGSSGGEGALIGMRGSVLGVGGDIGGSVRVPAANCGVYGFKPTAKRLGVKGMKATMGGSEGLQACFGPLASDRESINLFMQTFLDARPWRIDASLDNKPWNPATLPNVPLKIGLMSSDNVVQPHPPIARALHQVATACSGAGMTVVEWHALDHAKAWDLYVSLLYPDGGAAARAPLEETGEPVLPLTKWITSEQAESKTRTIHEYWELVMERDSYRDFHAAYWNATGENDGHEVDVVLCPVGPSASTLHDTARYWSYTSHWNLLDYPAAVFPVTFVDPQLDLLVPEYQPRNEQDAANWQLYDPAKWSSAPVCLQLVGRRGNDEFVMAALKEIERAMGRD